MYRSPARLRRRGGAARRYPAQAAILFRRYLGARRARQRAFCRGRIKPEDHALLVQHRQAWQTYITAVRQVHAQGITVTNPEMGCPRKNPALSAAETAGAQLLASCREFGLTPSSEQRLAAAPADDDGGDPFAG